MLKKNWNGSLLNIKIIRQILKLFIIMKNILQLNRVKCFQKFLILPISVVLFCSFTGKGFQYNLVNEQRTIREAYQRIPVHFNHENQQQKFIQVAPTNGSGLNNTESEYPGGKQGWMMYLMQHLRYPLNAMNNNIQGTVIVKFIVNEKGRLKQLDVISGPKELRQEAIRVIQESGRWMPAKENGKPVKSEKEQAIIFKREFPAS
jgi:TonB family protein